MLNVKCVDWELLTNWIVKLIEIFLLIILKNCNRNIMLLSNQPANAKPQPTSPSPTAPQSFKVKLQQQIAATAAAAAAAAATIANGNSNISNNNSHHHHQHLNNHQHHQHNISFATDFSIAAIMARGGNPAPSNSREPSERSLSE